LGLRPSLSESLVANTFRYTNKDGWNAVRSQPTWRFKASQPKDPDRPMGAYFTDMEPTATNIRLIHKHIRVPRSKQQYIFWFIGTEGLFQLNEGRGRDRRILFSRVDYSVTTDRQWHGGLTEQLIEVFQ
jgi:hypothetical protein